MFNKVFNKFFFLVNYASGEDEGGAAPGPEGALRVQHLLRGVRGRGDLGVRQRPLDVQGRGHAKMKPTQLFETS